jgi:hypothetical protein
MRREPRLGETDTPVFNAIWDVVKSWERTNGSTRWSVTGNDVCEIIDAISRPKIISCACGQALLAWWADCHMCGRRRK